MKERKSVWIVYCLSTGMRCRIKTNKRHGEPGGRFHLEASIAMLHCHASSVEETRWSMIVGLYDRLVEFNDSPLYRLNRAIAVAQCGDEAEAMSQLRELEDHDRLGDSFLLDCAIAKVHELAGNRSLAIDRLLQALSRNIAEHERALIKRKIAAL